MKYIRHKISNVYQILPSHHLSFALNPPVRHSVLFIASRSDLLSAHLEPGAASQSEVGAQISLDFFRLIAINENK